ncbi:tyrosine-type recombinase/integrase [Alkalicoccus urumqiensis]|uniref:Recombinase n=1 Tax=Alkalicoccus urumqiensis TaxID=1548213 RepID=A0A2P6MHN9_ALKUR|nr:tyrosine-type recombinase/integrase [Alkalicoccus urumqiensis]PRO65812.1 recombinase [Alkalicoccus urumqiensis]
MKLDQAKVQFLEHLKKRKRSPVTQEGYERDLAMFHRFVCIRANMEVELEDVREEDLQAYLTHLEDHRHYKPASLNRHITVLRSFFQFCLREELVPKDPSVRMLTFSIPSKERAYPGPADAEKLIQAIHHPIVRPLVELLYLTGLRISEARDLKVEDLDMERRRLYVRCGKGGKARTIPMSAELHSMLQSYLPRREAPVSPYLFSTKRAGRVAASFVNEKMHQAAADLGWKQHYSAHSLRHAFATRLLHQGEANLVHVQKLLGHTNVQTTSIYLHADMETLEDVLNKGWGGDAS